MYREGSINQFSQIIGLGNFYCNYLAIYHYFFQIKTFSVVDNNIIIQFNNLPQLLELFEIPNFSTKFFCVTVLLILLLTCCGFFFIYCYYYDRRQYLADVAVCLSVVEGHLSCIVTIFASLAVNLYFLYYYGWCHLYVENGALTIPTCGSVTL